MTYGATVTITNSTSDDMTPASPAINLTYGTTSDTAKTILAGKSQTFHITPDSQPSNGSNGTITYSATAGSTTENIEFTFQCDNGEDDNVAAQDADDSIWDITNTNYSKKDHPLKVTWTVKVAS